MKVIRIISLIFIIMLAVPLGSAGIYEDAVSFFNSIFGDAIQDKPVLLSLSSDSPTWNLSEQNTINVIIDPSGNQVAGVQFDIIFDGIAMTAISNNQGTWMNKTPNIFDSGVFETGLIKNSYIIAKDAGGYSDIAGTISSIDFVGLVSGSHTVELRNVIVSSVDMKEMVYEVKPITIEIIEELPPVISEPSKTHIMKLQTLYNTWDGRQVLRENLNVENGNFTYHRTENLTHYFVERNKEVLPALEKAGHEYDWQPERISVTVLENTLKEDLTKTEGFTKYIVIPQSKESKEFVWDNSQAIIKNVTDGSIRTIETKYEIDSKTGELKAYLNTSALTKSSISFESYIINNASTTAWTSGNVSSTNVSYHGDGNISLSSNHSINDGLVGYWPFQGSGTIANNMNSPPFPNATNQGTLTNMNTGLNNCTGNCSGWTSGGRIGNGMAFDDVNDYVDAGNDASLNIINSITVSAWVYPKICNAFNDIVVKGTSYDSDSIYALGFRPAVIDWEVGNGTRSLKSQTYALPLNNWTHLVGTFDGVNQTIYINGIKYNFTSSISKIGTTSSTLKMGGGTRFNGSIDEVRIYNRALSSSEIAILYNTSLKSTGNIIFSNNTASSGFIHSNVSGTWNNGIAGIDNVTIQARANGTTSWTDIAVNAVSGTFYDVTALNNRSLDYQFVQSGNGSNTTFLQSVTWNEVLGASNYIPPSPISLTNTSGFYWVNYTWQPGSGNITDSYNVSITNNSIQSWINGSSAIFINSTLAAGQWSNISVYAYNSSGTGSLNTTPISANVKLNDTIIIISIPYKANITLENRLRLMQTRYLIDFLSNDSMPYFNGSAFKDSGLYSNGSNVTYKGYEILTTASNISGNGTKGDKGEPGINGTNASILNSSASSYEALQNYNGTWSYVNLNHSHEIEEFFPINASQISNFNSSVNLTMDRNLSNYTNHPNFVTNTTMNLSLSRYINDIFFVTNSTLNKSLSGYTNDINFVTNITMDINLSNYTNSLGWVNNSTMASDNLKINKSGDNMTGGLNMSNNNISNIQNIYGIHSVMYKSGASCPLCPIPPLVIDDAGGSTYLAQYMAQGASASQIFSTYSNDTTRVNAFTGIRYNSNDTTNFNPLGAETWMFFIGARGTQDTSTNQPGGSKAGILIKTGSVSAWNSTNTPTSIVFQTTPEGSVTRTDSLIIDRTNIIAPLLSGTGNTITQIDSTGKIFVNRTAGAGIPITSPDGTARCLKVDNAGVLSALAGVC